MGMVHVRGVRIHVRGEGSMWSLSMERVHVHGDGPCGLCPWSEVPCPWGGSVFHGDGLYFMM